MPYEKEVYAAAQARLAERWRRAEEQNRRTKEALYRKIPRLREIEQELNETGIRAAKEILARRGGSERGIEALRRRNLALQAERAELLTAHSLPADALDVKYFCPLCGDTGVTGEKYCSCLHKLLREEACRTANLGSPLPLSAFDTFRLDYYPEEKLPDFDITVRQHMERVFGYCKQYADDFSQKHENLLLLGPTGLGKTHLALAVANRAIQNGAGVLYDTAQDIFGRMEDEYFGRAEKKYSPLVFGCDLLVLDDLGAEFNISFNASALYNIINTRTLARRPTVVSTNLDFGELTPRYGQRIVSRLIGEFTMLRFFGRDIRQLRLTRG